MLKIISLSLILAFPVFSQAQDNNFQPKPAENYRILENPATELKGTQLFFWYGCKSCFQLARLLKQQHSHWQQTPVSLYKKWRPQTKIFYTLRNLELPFSVDKQLMAVIHNSNLSANDFFVQKKFLIETGIDAETFDRAFYSKEVNQQTSNSDKIKNQLNLQKVPSALVGGKYYTDLSMNENLQQFMQSIIYLEQLVAQEIQTAATNTEATQP